MNTNGSDPVLGSPTLPPDAASRPLLSIGLAVYNGESHLRVAIDSLLAQDVGDLELVISDNASTDDTRAICLEYVEADSRVRYHCNAENIGAAANYQQVFEMCSGEYFMWGSDDDIWEPRFAGECISRLESSPKAVLCTAGVMFITDDGERDSTVAYRSIDTDGMPVEGRVHELISRPIWYGIYGVIRPTALRAAPSFLPVYGGDVCLLLELMLLGDLIAVPEPLFSYRLPSKPRTVADHVNDVRPPESGATPREPTRAPYTSLARELLGILDRSSLDDTTVRRIQDDLAETLCIVNLDWGRSILSEQGLSLDQLRADGAALPAVRAALGLAPARDGLEERQSAPEAWSMHDGVKLAPGRQMLLRLLQPFSDRQNALNAERARALELLAYEVRRLQHRIEALERGRA